VTEAPNGLASLTQARERRVRRTMPPPRHPIVAAESAPITDTEQVSTDQAPPSEAPHVEPTVGERAPEPAESLPPPPARRPSATAGPKPRGRRSTEPAATQAPTATAATPIKPVTVYVSDEQSDFLEQVRIAGLMERVDISRSAVVRLALSRLQQHMSVEDIKRHLVSQPTDPTRTGRKRR
jgi:hypothetical protein